jgi:hypothetical protein
LSADNSSADKSPNTNLSADKSPADNLSADQLVRRQLAPYGNSSALQLALIFLQFFAKKIAAIFLQKKLRRFFLSN